ncbi:MAG: hypothetical protein CMN25_00680 [Salinicola sp.]|uniref:hypothetical protein n=1 Tax=uncultured Salinicola sp. TaxID=1193542 RepID=UPI000C91FD3F|nr:hypothetical protein [uncultured Salinicola sp.]MAM55838.1 hypothetical protein [Salinicola sp.]|tara:strand:- start:1725 stop:2126 length:402 start_codon:yes stop_codon:yes gene_type:complete
MTGAEIGYFVAVIFALTGLALIVCGCVLRSWRNAVMGVVMMGLSGFGAEGVYDSQPLPRADVRQASIGDGCVARTLRSGLAELDEPMTRQGLSDIEDDCERQAKRLAKSEAKQAVLEQQRQAAHQPEAEVGKE